MLHFIKHLRVKALKLGLFNNDCTAITENLLKELSISPYKYEDNHNLFEKIFDKYEKEYQNENITAVYIKNIFYQHGYNIFKISY